MGTKLSSLPNLKKKPTPVKGSSEQRAYVRQQYYNPNKDEPSHQALVPATEQLKKLEEIIHTNPPKDLNSAQLATTSEGCCETQRFKDSNNIQYFQKPRKNERQGIRQNVTGNYAGREVAAYEMTKALGLEGLVPPTTMYKPKVNGIQSDGGSIQLDAFTHGIEYGLKDVYTPNVATSQLGLQQTPSKIFDQVENSSDAFAFDAIIGNTDRHGGNQYVGEDNGGERYMIGIDHGLSFPNKKVTKFDQYWGNNDFQFFEPIATTSNKRNVPINSELNHTILTIPKDVIKGIGNKANLSKEEIDCTQERLLLLRNGTKEKIKKTSLQNKKSSMSGEGLKNRKNYIIDKSRLTPNEMYDIMKNGFNKYSGSSQSARVISGPSPSRLRIIQEQNARQRNG